MRVISCPDFSKVLTPRDLELIQPKLLLMRLCNHAPRDFYDFNDKSIVWSIFSSEDHIGVFLEFPSFLSVFTIKQTAFDFLNSLLA